MGNAAFKALTEEYVQRTLVFSPGRATALGSITILAWLALLPDGGPTGSFFQGRKAYAW